MTNPNEWARELSECSDVMPKTLKEHQEICYNMILDALSRRDKERTDEVGKGLRQFGDIFTNGINYWMVVGSGGVFGEELRPVVMNKEKNRVECFVGFYSGGVSSIKPYATYLGNIHSLATLRPSGGETK